MQNFLIKVFKNIAEKMIPIELILILKINESFDQTLSSLYQVYLQINIHNKFNKNSSCQLFNKSARKSQYISIY